MGNPKDGGAIVLEDGRASETASAIAKAGGLGTALFAGMTAQELAAIGGLTITALAFLVSLWYQHKRFKLMKKQLADEKVSRDEHLSIARARLNQAPDSNHSES